MVSTQPPHTNYQDLKAEGWAEEGFPIASSAILEPVSFRQWELNSDSRSGAAGPQDNIGDAHPPHACCELAPDPRSGFVNKQQRKGECSAFESSFGDWVEKAMTLLPCFLVLEFCEDTS